MLTGRSLAAAAKKTEVSRQFGGVLQGGPADADCGGRGMWEERLNMSRHYLISFPHIPIEGDAESLRCMPPL